MSTLQKADGLICVDVFMSYQICQSRFSRHSEGGQVPIAYDAGGYYLLGYVNFQLG
jgi:hypothetical protein